ncbi:aldo/keto reductase [Xanthocytophaga agilis]|uniref:Aldo/keto reductase n=1 Tax=Xanthocytophaga agilis TaxID=3048010 RepID=A0AAE3UJL0_9BACT|nr:aldo/keto reductase [Xanthocytophaga agilis]MDJ1506072.1 aldo/keto reductase [Xanthocytophaga agilis]
MPLNHYVTMGHSGLRVSPFCLGTMTFGEDLGWGTSVEDANTIMDYYLDAGGNFLDTANVYTFGHSEKIIGDHIGRHSHRRDRVVIATKFFGTLYSGDPNAGGANRKSLMTACDNSLRRLQTDYIDLYWLHCWDKFTPIEETLRGLDDLVTAGKIRYIGFSDTPAWKVAEAQTIARLRGWAPLIALQIEYNLLERTVEGELMPMAKEMGLGVTPWSPLKSGVLSGKYRRENAGQLKADRGAWVENNLNEQTYKVIDVLISIAEQLGTTPARVALAWLQAQPGVTSTILGARTLDQLKDNLAALDVQLQPQHLAALHEVSKPKLNFPYDFLARSGAFSSSGTTINGETNPINPLTPTNDQQRY